ncbi:MAG TPA: ATP-binding protein [Bryobacteraceae bacterium]|jgi:signal transduction histidine kinase
MKLPIRIRLALIYSTILMTTTGTLELAGYYSVLHTIHSLVDRELNTRLAGIEDHLARHLPRYSWPRMGQDLDAHPAFQPSLLSIRDSSGAVLFEGSSMTGVSLASTGISTGNSGSGAFRLLSAKRVINGQALTLTLGTDLQVASAILRRVWLIMLLSLPLFAMASVGIGYWMSGRALAPIQEIVRAVRSLDSRRLNQRVPVPATGDEVQLLAETFNGMLARIEAEFQKMHDFTANASHELRTPVAIVRAAAEVALLREGGNEVFYRQTLEQILRESERNSTLLENMLQLAHSDAGADARKRDGLNLKEYAVSACEQVAPLAASRQITVRHFAAASPVEVLADPEQLRRLLLILLDNAIKYTPPGGAVNVRIHEDEMGRPVCGVQDTGIGIALEQQPLIFERFYRTDKARSRSLGGAGLGLAIARGIALMHDADLRVESSLGAGSCFTVTFPSSRSIHATVAANADPSVVR